MTKALGDDPPDAVPHREVGPGGTLRFAVGNPLGRRSSTYRVWSSKNATDVYIAARAIAGIQKVSLRASGSWQHSFVSDAKAQPFVSDGAARHVDLWSRPDEFGEGWTRAYSIIVPGTELRRRPEDVPAEKGDVVFVDRPRPHGMVHFEVLLARPGAARLLVDDMQFVGRMALCDGSGVVVIARDVVPGPDKWRGLIDIREAMHDRVSAAVLDGTLDAEIPGVPVLGVYGYEDDGTRFVLELALTMPSPGDVRICDRASSQPGRPQSKPVP